MKYKEFRENIAVSGFTFKSLAELLNMNPASICNYSSKGTVPETMAVLSILLKEARLSDPLILERLVQYKPTCMKVKPGEIKKTETSTPDSADTGIKPILKWAGGKTQLLPFLIKHVPSDFGTYIEPFIGGGALFFHLSPKKAIISDSNVELTNLYRVIAKSPIQLIKMLSNFKNERDFYYEVRSQKVENLDPIEAAARTIYLNKTCFNGLYRVNRQGQFNTPYGSYKRTSFIDETNLIHASNLLKRATILEGDFQEVVQEFARPKDFVFFDPPYLPVSKFADFNRYTKETFTLEDQQRLATLAERLSENGVHVLLTNSTAPLVFDLYKEFGKEVVQTKRYISKTSETRKGEDSIIFPINEKKCSIEKITNRSLLPWEEQIALFPSSRYMGSKSKLVPNLASIFQELSFNSAIDLFCGSSSVGYLLKSLGKKVLSNDYMVMNQLQAKAIVENSNILLPDEKALQLLVPPILSDNFISENFKGLYFSDEDNKQIDILRTNIAMLKNEFEYAIAKSSLIRAALKKRPRGIFTFTGFRYDDGRLDLRKSIFEHFLEGVKIFNQAVFDNGCENRAFCEDAMHFSKDADLVYMDPPYCSRFSDNEYVRRYHFLEGLARDWNGVEIQQHTKTKKFRSYPTPFSNKVSVYTAFESLIAKHKEKIIILSYSSNSLPTKEEIKEMFEKQEKDVSIFEIDHKYSCGNQGHKTGDNKNNAKEFVFVAR